MSTTPPNMTLNKVRTYLQGRTITNLEKLETWLYHIEKAWMDETYKYYFVQEAEEAEEATTPSTSMDTPPNRITEEEALKKYVDHHISPKLIPSKHERDHMRSNLKLLFQRIFKCVEVLETGLQTSTFKRKTNEGGSTTTWTRQQVQAFLTDGILGQNIPGLNQICNIIIADRPFTGWLAEKDFLLTWAYRSWIGDHPREYEIYRRMKQVQDETAGAEESKE